MKALPLSRVTGKPFRVDTRAVRWNNFVHTTAPAGNEAGNQDPPEVSADARSKDMVCPSPVRMS
jgi:hypothetical protein